MVYLTTKILGLVISAIKNLCELKGSTSREILHYISSVYNIPTAVARRQVDINNIFHSSNMYNRWRKQYSISYYVFSFWNLEARSLRISYAYAYSFIHLHFYVCDVCIIIPFNDLITSNKRDELADINNTKVFLCVFYAFWIIQYFAAITSLCDHKRDITCFFSRNVYKMNEFFSIFYINPNF